MNLLRPFEVSEIETVISQQKSGAKGLNGTSPLDIKSIGVELAPILCRIFNDTLHNGTAFPKQWMSSVFFFLHKKGSQDDPANYRSLAIEDPIFKIFTSALCSRLTELSKILSYPNTNSGLEKTSLPCQPLRLPSSKDVSKTPSIVVSACTAALLITAKLSI